MFGSLTTKLSRVFSGLMQKKILTEENVDDAVREVRLALLEADVNYAVAKEFVRRIREKVVGQAVIKSVTPAQQFMKLVHDELVELMGGKEASVHVQGSPAIILLCGLQGSGKTTQAAKLAYFFSKKGKKSLLVACDLQRPAAVEQLKVLGRQADVPVFAQEAAVDVVRVAEAAVKEAKALGRDLVIVDTAGRLHIDEELMGQLQALKKALKPTEVLFVANAATGQDAVATAKTFDERIEITGTILTMLDGDARAGAALSIREVTKKPLKFEGVGEGLEDLQVFHPVSMADRILGMGDTINLVKRAEEHINEEEAKNLEEKLRKASFTYEDYVRQMQMMKKMGPLKNLLKMMPGMSGMDLDVPQDAFKGVEAMILSMTAAERQEKTELSPSRRRRIAKGSGQGIEEVNRLIKNFKQAKQFFKNMPNKKQLEKMMGGMAAWH